MMVATKDMGKRKKAIVLRMQAQKKMNEWKKHFFEMRKQRDALRLRVEALERVIKGE